MELVRICGIAVLGAAVSVVVGRFDRGVAAVCAAVASVVVTGAVLTQLAPLLGELEKLLCGVLDQAYTVVPIKAVGIGITTQITSDICRDCGEAGVASKVELAGKVALLMISLPLMRDILELSTSVLGI